MPYSESDIKAPMGIIEILIIIVPIAFILWVVCC